MSLSSSRAGVASRACASRPRASPLVRRAPFGGMQSSGIALPGPRRVACNGLFGLGIPEVAVILGISALVFGPAKLPELGKSLGSTVKSFQTAAKEFEEELKTAAAPDEDPKKVEAKKEEKKSE